MERISHIYSRVTLAITCDYQYPAGPNVTPQWQAGAQRVIVTSVDIPLVCNAMLLDESVQLNPVEPWIFAGTSLTSVAVLDRGTKDADNDFGQTSVAKFYVDRYSGGVNLRYTGATDANDIFTNYAFQLTPGQGSVITHDGDITVDDLLKPTIGFRFNQQGVSTFISIRDLINAQNGHATVSNQGTWNLVHQTKFDNLYNVEVLSVGLVGFDQQNRFFWASRTNGEMHYYPLKYLVPSSPVIVDESVMVFIEDPQSDEGDLCSVMSLRPRYQLESGDNLVHYDFVDSKLLTIMAFPTGVSSGGGETSNPELNDSISKLTSVTALSIATGIILADESVHPSLRTSAAAAFVMTHNYDEFGNKLLHFDPADILVTTAGQAVTSSVMQSSKHDGYLHSGSAKDSPSHNENPTTKRTYKQTTDASKSDRI